MVSDHFAIIYLNLAIFTLRSRQHWCNESGERAGPYNNNTCEQREMSYSRTERNYSNQYEQLGDKQTCASIYSIISEHTRRHTWAYLYVGRCSI